MKLFEELLDNIEEEYEDAKKYIKMAMAYREKFPNDSKLFAQLSGEELSHADRQKRAVMDHLRMAEGHEHHEKMEIIWEHVHRRFSECEEHIKVLMDMYSRG